MPSSSRNPSYHISTFPFPALEKPLQTIFEKKQLQEFSISTVEHIEGCYPILRERWKFKYDPNDPSEVEEPQQYEEIVRTLRAIALAISVISLYDNSKLQLQISTQPNEDLFWDVSLQQKDVKSFPKSPIILQNTLGKLIISAEYITSNIKPRIARQTIGLRPRLVSLDYGEDGKEGKKLNFSFASTETSPQDLNRMRNKKKLLSLIASESFYEENEIGFKMIASELDDMESSENSFGHNSFEMKFEENLAENNENASISIYNNQCKAMGNLKIFASPEINCSELVSSWKKNSLMF